MADLVFKALLILCLVPLLGGTIYVHTSKHNEPHFLDTIMSTVTGVWAFYTLYFCFFAGI